MEPQRLQNRAIFTKWNCEFELIKLPMIVVGCCTTLCLVELKATNASHSGVSDVNILTDRAHQEGHFHHARLFLALSPWHSFHRTLVAWQPTTVWGLQGNWERRAEDRKDGMFRVFCLKLRCCVYSFLSFLLFFSSLVIFIRFFPLAVQLPCSVLSRDKEKIVASLSFPIPTLSIPPNLPCNVHSLLHIWSFSTLSHTIHLSLMCSFRQIVLKLHRHHSSSSWCLL